MIGPTMKEVLDSLLEENPEDGAVGTSEGVKEMTETMYQELTTKRANEGDQLVAAVKVGYSMAESRVDVPTIVAGLCLLGLEVLALHHREQVNKS